MPRKKTTLSEAATEALWLAYETVTSFKKSALADVPTVTELLGISAEVLPALADNGVLMPAADARGAIKKYVLKEVICLRGDESALKRIRKIEIEHIRNKNAKQSRKREPATPAESAR